MSFLEQWKEVLQLHSFQMLERFRCGSESPQLAAYFWKTMGPCYLFLLVLEVPSSTLAQTVLLPFTSVNSMGFGMACNKHSQQVSTCVSATSDGEHQAFLLPRERSHSTR
jgi:hypothetical protein